MSGSWCFLAILAIAVDVGDVQRGVADGLDVEAAGSWALMAFSKLAGPWGRRTAP